MRPSLLVFIPAVGLMVGSAALPAAAPARAETPARQCFFQRQISNFRSGADQAVYLRVNGSDVYKLSTAGGCAQLADSNQLAVTPESGSSRLCTDEWAVVSAPGSNGPLQTCRAHIEKKLTEAEIAALPAGDRP